VSLCSVLPDVVWSAWASFVPSASSCAQFFEVAKVGVPELVVVVVVAADVDVELVVCGEADFFFDPPQPAATNAQTTAATAKSLSTARRV
jgi:hypothetical protein